MTLDVLIAWLCWVTFALSVWALLDEIARCLPARDPALERREHEERLGVRTDLLEDEGCQR